MSVRHVGFSHDAKGRSTNRRADSRLRANSGPPKGEPWVWLTAELLASPAMRSLSGVAWQALARLLLEQMAHAGRANGKLTVTYDQFAAHGIRRSSVSRAIRELEQAGLVVVTVQGGRAYGNALRPSRYRLSWLPDVDGIAPTDEWRKVGEEISPDRKSCLGPGPISGLGAVFRRY